MNNYYISINEILSRTVSIKAESIEEALRITKELYLKAIIELDYEDFVDYEIEDLHELADDSDYSIEDLEGNN